MALSDFDTPTLWRRDLDTRWPERLLMKRLLVETIHQYTIDVPGQARILELGIGDGELLQEIYARCPDASIVALDINKSLLTHCRDLLPPASVQFSQQDLREPWVEEVGAGFDIIFSLQSFHDLGGRDALLDVYSRIAGILSSGGLLLNADFVVPMAHDDPDMQRRFPQDIHFDLLDQCGFTSFRMLKRFGTLGCIKAIR